MAREVEYEASFVEAMPQGQEKDFAIENLEEIQKEASKKKSYADDDDMWATLTDEAGRERDQIEAEAARREAEEAAARAEEENMDFSTLDLAKIGSNLRHHRVVDYTEEDWGSLSDDVRSQLRKGLSSLSP